jgi:CRISPR-associated protein Cas1
MASPALTAFPDEVLRRPPARAQSAQYNWLTDRYEVRPEQLDLDMAVPDDVVLPHDRTVTLLATENGAQLFVAGFGLYIGKKGERIVVKQAGKVCAQVPFMRAQEVIIGSRGVSFSSDLLEELCSRGIRVACLSSSGRPVALITSPLLSATVETRRQQMAAFSNERGANFCRWIVAGKLHNQEKLLRYFAKSRAGSRREELEATAAKLRKFRRDALAVEGSTADEVRPTLMGLEGTGGRMYWQRIGDMLPEELGFEGRHRRDSERQGPGDAVNAALNYGYGILYSHVWGAVMNAGLEPFAGFMHVDRSGKPSMVLDLVEEFRQPVADRAILTWLNKGGKLVLVKGMLDGESRENVAARVLLRLNTRERHRGKEHEVRSIVQMQARRAASAFRGMRDYRPFAFQW